MFSKPIQAQDVCIVVPPFSPNDTNPPLGPALLRASLREAGFDATLLDLNIRFLNAFGGASSGASFSPNSVIGDHDKDRPRIRRARSLFREITPLRDSTAAHVPVGVDPVFGMCFDFDEVKSAVNRAAQPGHPWREFLDTHLFKARRQPRVLGISLMGPGSVFGGLVVALLARRLWKGTLVVAGGSHVTALADVIARDRRYGETIHAYLPGHSEAVFVDVVRRTLRSPWRRSRGRGAWCDHLLSRGCLVPGTRWETSVDPRATGFLLAPGFSRRDLSLHDPARVTIPLQLSRGCAFGRCAFCTYPVVEPYPVTACQIDSLGAFLASEVTATGVLRFSFKDAFLTAPLMRRIVDAVRASGVEIEWSGATRAHPKMLASDILGEIAGSGCRTLEFGLESIWPGSQRLVGKRVPRDEVEHLLEAAGDRGIHSVVNLIYGFPGETYAHAARQRQWIRAAETVSNGLLTGSEGILEINRGSPMARAPQRFGIRACGVAPWAFSHDWDAPEWLRAFAAEAKERVPMT